MTLQATLIPVGARLVRSYWAVPTHYSSGDEYPSREAALVAAIEKGRTHPNNRVTIDLRWSMEWEATAENRSSGTDTVAERFTYDNIAVAEEALARLRKFAPENR